MRETQSAQNELTIKMVNQNNKFWLNIFVNATTAELKYLADYKVANPVNNQGIKLRGHNTIITQRGHEFS